MSQRLKPRVGELEQYLQAGLQLIPLNLYYTKDPKGRDRGKSPLHGQWQKRDYTAEAVIKQAAAGYNVGIRLTHEVMVLDVDPRNMPEGRDTLAELVRDLRLDLSVCPHTITGSGGHHYWFKKPANAPILDSLPDYEGVEFKSFGRQVVASGSVHPSGSYYEWDDFAPPLLEMPAMPDNFLNMIRRVAKVAGSEAAGYGEMDCERLEKTLALLDPTDFQKEQDWRDLMMACHHATAGEGRQEFVDWSTSDPQYQDHGREVGYRWDSLDRAARQGRAITVRYLYKVVQDAGHEVPPVPPEDDFDVWEEVEDGEGVDDDKLSEPPEMDLIDQMNERYAVLNDGGKFRVVQWAHDPVLKRDYLIKSGKNDFLDFMGNRIVETANGATPLGRYWLMSSRRLSYDGVIFDPSRDHEGYLNLWKGWAVTPKKGDWSLLQDLILEVLCSGNQKHADYVMNWLAYMVQHPSKPAEVALCFRGDKGTGKGTLGRAVKDLAGPQGLHIASPEHLTGRFNSHLQNVICLFADEAFWAGDKSGESKLKALVTEPTITIEGKGVDVVTAKNLIHIIMASNSDWVVPAGMDGERRFAVFEVSAKRRGDHAYFKALNEQLENGGREAMLFDLMTRDIEGWAPRNDVPQTAALLAQKLTSMDATEKWWLDVLTRGHLPGAPGVNWEEGPVSVIKEKVMNHLTLYYKMKNARPYEQYGQPQSLGSWLSKMVPDISNTQVKPADDDFETVPPPSGKCSAWKFPPLEKCRKAFTDKMGGEIEGFWL